jgi:O-antigen ligase
MKARLGFWQYGHAHNSLLQYLWDFGILGALSFTLFLIGWIVTMASRKHGGLKQLCVFLTFMTIQSEISFEIDLRFK